MIDHKFEPVDKYSKEYKKWLNEMNNIYYGIESGRSIAPSIAKFKVAKHKKTPKYSFGNWTPHLHIPDLTTTIMFKPNVHIYGKEKYDEMKAEVTTVKTNKLTPVGKYNMKFDELRKVFIHILIKQDTYLSILQSRHTFLGKRMLELYHYDARIWLKKLSWIQPSQNSYFAKDLSSAYSHSYGIVNKEWQTFLTDLTLAKEKDLKESKARRIRKLKRQWFKRKTILTLEQFLNPFKDWYA